MPNRQEIPEEFRIVFSGDNAILDSVVPPLLFLHMALAAAVGLAFAFAHVSGL